MAIVGADQVTIVDLTDGYSVNMSPESYAFPATATAAIAGSVTTLITALVGPDPIAATVNVGEITAPAGVSVTKDTNVTTPTLTISVTTAVTQPGIVVVPVHVGDVTITKRFAFSLAKTGATGGAGVSATNVIIGNESAIIPTNAAGFTTAIQTITIPFAGYVGTTRANPTSVVVSGLPTGITSAVTNATTGDGSVVLTVASNTNLGGALSGNITLTFTANTQTHIKFFGWAKAVAGTAGANGANGDDGLDGADAIVLAVTSSNGTIFKNTAIATTLTARVFVGGVEVTGGALTALGTISWYKDGGATSVGTGPSLVLDAGQVTNKAVYEARLETA